MLTPFSQQNLESIYHVRKLDDNIFPKDTSFQMQKNISWTRDV